MHTIATVKYKKSDSVDYCLDRHNEIGTINGNELDTNWQDSANIGEKHADHLQEVVEAQV